MPDFLALDWEHRHVCGLDAEVAPAGVRVRKAFTLAWPEGKSPDVDAPAAGGWLNEQLQALGLTAKQVLVTVPREDAVTRVLEVPDVPDAELPEVVRFQAAAKSARSLDTLLLDFLPLPKREGVSGREVLVATIGREVLDSLRVVLARAGCEVASVGLTATAMVELLARMPQAGSAAATPADAANIVELAIVKHEYRVEISLLRQRGLLLTHSARLPDDAVGPERERQAVVAEVNRSLVALRRQHPEMTLSRAWLWGDVEDYRDLGDLIGKRFHCDVRIADPLHVPGLFLDSGNGIGSHALFTGPAGLLFGQSERLAAPLDFLNPRRPVVPRDLRPIIIAASTAAAILIIGGAWALRAYRMSALRTDIARQREESKKIDDTLKRSQPSVKSADTIQRWVDQRVAWLDRLNELTTTMQGTEAHYLTKLVCQPGTVGAPGTLRGAGYARNRDDVESFYARLTKRDGMTVHTHPIDRAGVDGDYPIKFELDLSIRPPSAKTAAAEKSSTTPPADNQKTAPAEKASGG